MKRILHNLYKMTAAALAVALLLGSVSATFLGNWLKKNQLELSDTASLTHGTLLMTGKTTKQTESIVEYTPDPAVTPIVAFGTTLYGRSTIDYVRQHVESKGKSIVAGINASFFDMATGIPLGCEITEGLLRCSGDTQSVGFRSDGTAVIGKPGVSIDITYPNGKTSNVHYNKMLTKSNGIVLYSRDFDAKTKNTISAYNVVLQPETATLAPNGVITATVTGIVKDAKSCDIPAGGMVLSVATQTEFANTMAERIMTLKVGDTISIATKTAEDWTDVVYACGGGELLVSAGKAQTGFTLDSAKNMTARTAVGLKADGTLVLYALDGSQANSLGLPLEDLAKRLVELGCQTAINLDGGGSTTVGATYPGDTASTIVNTPSDGSLRRCANFIFLVRDTMPAGETAHLHLYPYDALALPGAKVPFTVKATDENYTATTAPTDRIYTAQGGTVDETGVFTAGSAGTAAVSVQSGTMASSRAVTVLNLPSTIAIQDEGTKKTLNSLSVTARDKVNLKASAAYQGLGVYSQDDLYTWSVTGDIGTIDKDGVFTAVQTTQDLKGAITASFGSVAKTIDVTVKAMTLSGSAVDGFEAADPQVTGSTGLTAASCTDLTKVRYGQQSLELAYDFAAVTADPGQSKQVIATTSKALSKDDAVLGLWVYGDGSGNALSARILNGGATSSIWMATLDFTGWKYVTAELPAGEKTLAGFAITQQEGKPDHGIVYLDQVTASNGVLNDTTPPAISLNLTETSLEITVQDAGSGLSSVAVTVDGAAQTLTWEGGKASMPLPTDGSYHKVSVAASDRYGNLASLGADLTGKLDAGFVDTGSHWAKDYIAYLYREGVMAGSVNTQGQRVYRPNDSMTRQEFVVSLIRFLHVDTAQYAATQLPFADSDKIASWALDSVKAAYAMGLMTGSAKDGQLYANPAATITRQEAMAIIGRTQPKGYQEADLGAFSDSAAVASWAQSYIASMVSRGIIAGNNGKLEPTGQVTRAQVAKMLYMLS